MTLMSSALGTTMGLQSVALMGRAYSMVPKNWGLNAKPMKPKKLVRGFMDITVGTALLKPTASIVSTL